MPARVAVVTPAVYRIHCAKCGESIQAEHVHGGVPNVRGGRDRRFARVGCWNRCMRCGTLYEALPCVSREAKRQQKAQAKLEGLGQLSLLSLVLVLALVGCVSSRDASAELDQVDAGAELGDGVLDAGAGDAGPWWAEHKAACDRCCSCVFVLDLDAGIAACRGQVPAPPCDGGDQ